MSTLPLVRILSTDKSLSSKMLYIYYLEREKIGKLLKRVEDKETNKRIGFLPEMEMERKKKEWGAIDGES